MLLWQYLMLLINNLILIYHLYGEYRPAMHNTIQCFGYIAVKTKHDSIFPLFTE